LIESQRARRLASWLLALVLALLLVRLGAFAAEFGRRSLQMDFAAYYTAGRAASANLSPYLNHVAHDPSIWDGVATYRTSRFLYPPPAAQGFRPLAALPYARAKVVWMALALGALAGALWISGRIAGLDSYVAWLALAVLACAYYPLLALLERGQTDSVTLLLVLGAMAWAASGPRRALGAGALLAAAVWLKLHCVFLVPLLVLERRWRALLGFAAAACGLVALSFALDGPGQLLDYVQRDLPRIARHGERGPSDTRLPPEVLEPITSALSAGRTTLDGRAWDVEALRFVLNASLVRTPLGQATWSAARSIGLPFAPAHVSLVFFAAACGLALALGLGRRPPASVEPGLARLVDWQIALVLVLLCAPATWAMGTVWLLPAGAIVLTGLDRDRRTSTASRIASASVAAGLLLACVPYGLGRALLPERALDAQYIVAELLCLAGLVALRATRSINERGAR